MLKDPDVLKAFQCVQREGICQRHNALRQGHFSVLLQFARIHVMRIELWERERLCEAVCVDIVFDALSEVAIDLALEFCFLDRARSVA